MTDVDRRNFLIGAGFASAGAAVPTEASAIARPPKEMPPQAVGMLYDSTLCIGCKACVAACKAANNMPADIPEHLSGWNEYTWDSAEDLSGRTLNVIKVYRNGTVEQKDRETDGYAFVKRHHLDKAARWGWAAINFANPWYWGRQAVYHGGKEVAARLFMARIAGLVGEEAVRLYGRRQPPPVQRQARTPAGAEPAIASSEVQP